MKRPAIVNQINGISDRLLGVRPGISPGDLAYRRFVLPLGCFAALGGFMSVPIAVLKTLCGQVVGQNDMPEWVFLGFGLFAAAMGVGMIARRRAAWIAFLAYWLVGTPVVVGHECLQAIRSEHPDVGYALLRVLFAVVMETAGVIVLIQGRPAFQSRLAAPAPSESS